MATLAATIAGGGIGIVGSAMQFSDKRVYAGDAVSIASGAASLVLSLVSVRLERGGKREIGIAPNMLAALFDRPAEPQSSYAPDVWAYLNSSLVNGTATETRIERLKREWVRQGRLPAGSAENSHNIERIASSFSAGSRMTLADLSDRYSMLSEVRAQVALMKRDLAELVRYLGQIGW